MSDPRLSPPGREREAGVAPGSAAARTSARSTVPITAVICTRRRPAQLRRALESLLRLDPSPAEILVVDNAPGDGSPTAGIREDFPGVACAAEPREGLDFARNRALRAAKEKVVAFLDDDAVAQPGWARAMAGVFDEIPEAGVCTGQVLPLCLETEGQRIFEANGGFGRGRSRIRLPEDARRPLHGRPAPLIAWAVSMGSGVSFAVRREWALELGGFDEALDLGPLLPGGGDHDMLWRMLEAGHHAVYEPAALALHEHRREREDAYRQIIGHQRALAAMLAKSLGNSRGRRRAGIALFLAWRLVKPGARVVRRLLRRDPLPVSALLDMWVNCWQGSCGYARCVDISRARRGADV
jgi:GT2 family glycosyltransferase